MTEKAPTVIPENRQSIDAPDVVVYPRPNDGERGVEAERAAEERSAAEFLLDFQNMKINIRENASNKLQSSLEQVVADGKNALSRPKNTFLRLRASSTQRKLDRISSKLDASRFDFINERRLKKAEALSESIKTRTEAHAAHSDMMNARTTQIEQRGVERNAEIEKRREDLEKARVEAIERRLIRHEKAKERRKLYQEHKYSSFELREQAIEKFANQPAFKKRIRAQAEKEAAKQPARTEKEGD